MTKQDNITIAIEAVKALVDAGWRLRAQVGENTLKIQTDSLTYAEDVLEELQLEVGSRVDNAFDNHILYLDNHNKAIAQYNYLSGTLILSIHRNSEALADYVTRAMHAGFELYDNPFTVLSLLSKMHS